MNISAKIHCDLKSCMNLEIKKSSSSSHRFSVKAIKYIFQWFLNTYHGLVKVQPTKVPLPHVQLCKSTLATCARKDFQRKATQSGLLGDEQANPSFQSYLRNWHSVAIRYENGFLQLTWNFCRKKLRWFSNWVWQCKENVVNGKETFANEDHCKRTTLVSSQDKRGHFL